MWCHDAQHLHRLEAVLWGVAVEVIVKVAEHLSRFTGDLLDSRNPLGQLFLGVLVVEPGRSPVFALYWVRVLLQEHNTNGSPAFSLQSRNNDLAASSSSEVIKQVVSISS